MLGGDIMFLFLFLFLLFLLFIIFISFIVSYFTCATLIIDLYYEVIYDICLLFFVLVCLLSQIAKMGSLLGSKKLGTNVLELQYVYVGKP